MMLAPHPIARRFLAEDLIRLRPASEQRRYVASQRSAKIDPNPHQIDAVLFALQRIPEGGCILADEVGVGCYIEEYELHGADRAAYGDRLMHALAQELSAKGLNRCDRGALYRYRSFYLAYPQIVATLSPQLLQALPTASSLAERARTPTPQAAPEKVATEIVATPSPRSIDGAEALLSRLSYSHLEQLVRIEDPDKRRFYEDHCVRGMWSVRELSRQIASLYYERTALSTDKVTLHEESMAAAEQEAPTLDLRDPYIFEFLGLRPAEVMGESELEDALIDKLHDFLLELGHGFCFEEPA